MLGTEGECGSGSDVIDVNVVDNRVGRLVNWVIKVLDVLCNNVSRKARQFEQPALRCTFLINNYDYIFKCENITTLVVLSQISRVISISGTLWLHRTPRYFENKNHKSIRAILL